MGDLLRIWERIEQLAITAGVEVQWKESLSDDFDAVRQHLRPEQKLATSYPCPGPSHDDCPRRVVTHAPGDIVAVCGNASPQCEPLKLQRRDLVIHRLDMAAWLGAITKALREANGLDPLELDAPAGVLAIGVLLRRGKRLPVVWMRDVAGNAEHIARGLRSTIKDDGLIALCAPGTRELADRAIGDGIVLLAPRAESNGNLALGCALDLLDPAYRERRVEDATAIFDDLSFEFAEEPGTRHVVRINGRDYGGFQKSDLKFLRLLMLAAARRLDADVDGGGWLDKFKLQGDEKDHDLEAVREELRKYDHPSLTAEERASLVKRSPNRDSKVRLAIAPTSIVFHESLADIQLIGEQQTQSKGNPKKGRTAGQSQRAENFAKRDKVAKKLLADVRKMGVPGPVAASRRGE